MIQEIPYYFLVHLLTSMNLQKEIRKRRLKMIRNIVCVGAVVACGCVIYMNADKIKAFIEEKANGLPKLRLTFEK